MIQLIEIERMFRVAAVVVVGTKLVRSRCR
jgi:hypothetical protein